ncbi:hypothetical protein BU24DRAFT_340960 [Aaosphaeria arxii CBS 175.79]|uniref:Uncharacterized protein n=1 Tax=Aaosphaeria arxii CBS 175.79 TaxID=1450172 RepID=A0A6A5Y0M5_9PLEO|nr:uncharacterized protein BU24DRAFT_340960 [Aaosphaeria arxii CBS 175.79]KAF2019088.1 hypothetical protein BU24DRAFT_340960 [Aaosphaeria arxii CBS 175.79]
MTHMGNMSGQPQSGPTMNLPFTPSKQGMSALETLAEVSRQHLDLSGKRIPGRKTPPPPQSIPQHNNPNNHGGLLDEFLIHDDRPDGLDSGTGSQGLDMTSAPALPSIYQFNGPLQHSPTNSPHLGHMSLPSSTPVAQMVPSLVMAASQANELSNLMPMTNGLPMEPELHLGNGGISDKFFHHQGRPQWPNMPTNTIDPLLQDHSRDANFPKDDPLNKPISHQRPIAMNPNGTQAHFTTDFSMNQKPSKPKVRGRFSDSRRKEVQEKPCSGGSPCSTCQNVESARLWKQPCIRTRISEEFNLYSAGLNGVLAFHAINEAKNQQLRLNQIPGRIEAAHHPESGVFATFTTMESHDQIAGSDIDPALMGALAPTGLKIIDGDDDIGGKIDLYMKKVSTYFFDSEDSAFMKTTMRAALSVASPNPDGLLTKVLELWNLTRMLTSPKVTWHLFFNPSYAPTIAPSTMSASELEDSARVPITSINSPHSYDLIKIQLEGAAEKRAGSLARVVMNDLERRLLQRQQGNPFETFLVAVILLSCVERMCWLFRTWEGTPSSLAQNESDPKSPHNSLDPPNVLPYSSDDTLAAALQSSTQASTNPQDLDHIIPANLDLPTRNPKWPFDKPPAYYSQQGERFSDILNMLLKMRGVPPKSSVGDDGVLTAVGDDVDARIKEWYEGINLSVDKLAERRNAIFEGKDPSEWELKYTNKIIGGN